MNVMTKTVRVKLTRMMKTTIMAALETRSIIPVLLEVGQSPNAFFVNVTKCKATAAAALLYSFSHAQPHKSPPHLLFTRLKFNSPGNGFQKDTSGPASYRFRQYPSPFRPGWMRSGEKGMGSGCNISSLNQSSYFCLSFLTALLSSWRHPMLKFAPRPKITFLQYHLHFLLSVHQPRLVIRFPLTMCQGWIYPV